jgi:hypothetical protein
MSAGGEFLDGFGGQRVAADAPLAARYFRTVNRRHVPSTSQNPDCAASHLRPFQLPVKRRCVISRSISSVKRPPDRARKRATLPITPTSPCMDNGDVRWRAMIARYLYPSDHRSGANITRILSGLMQAAAPALRFIKAGWGSEKFSSEPTSVENEMSVIQYALLCGDKIVQGETEGPRRFETAIPRDQGTGKKAR